MYVNRKNLSEFSRRIYIVEVKNKKGEKNTMNTIEINQDFSRALDVLLNTKENVFITGKAGTGKNTFLKWFRDKVSKNKNVGIVASTGLSVINVQGKTIHKFFKLNIIVKQK